MSVLTSNRTELPMKLETATNITLSADSLEAEDNMGRFEIMKPPGAWKDFYDRMLGEKGEGTSERPRTSPRRFSVSVIVASWRILPAGRSSPCDN